MIKLDLESQRMSTPPPFDAAFGQRPIASRWSQLLTSKTIVRFVLLACFALLCLTTLGIQSGQLELATIPGASRISWPSSCDAAPIPQNLTVVPTYQLNDITTWPSPTPGLPLDASLEQRLAAWNETPVSTAANWARFSAMTCPPSATDVNKLVRLVTINRISVLIQMTVGLCDAY